MRSKAPIKKKFALLKKHKVLLKRISLLTSVRGTQVILGLVTTYFLAHTLSIEQYGQYQFVLSVLGVVSIFSLTEFANTLMQSIARGYNGSFRKMLPYPLLFSLVGSLILIGFAYWYGVEKDNSMLLVCFVTGASLFPFTYGLILWRGFKIGEEKFFDYTKLEMFTLLATNIGIISTTLLFPETYIGAIVCVISIPALVNILMTTRVLKSISKTAIPEDGIIVHGIQSSVYMAFSRISNYADKLLLFMFVDAVSVAILVAADRISELLRSAIQDTATALAPEFAKTETYTRKLDTFFKLACLGFGVLMMIFAFTLLPTILVLIYGEHYKSAVPYAQILIFALSISNLASFQFRYIRSKLDTKNVKNIMLTVSICRIGMSAVFIPLFGLNGAVLSSLLYHLILTFMTDCRIRKDYL